MRIIIGASFVVTGLICLAWYTGKRWGNRVSRLATPPYVALLFVCLLAGCFRDSTSPDVQRSQNGGTVRINLCVYYFPATDTVCAK